LGASDKIAAQPTVDRQTVENLAATVLSILGIPHDAQWIDFDGRPHEVYRAEPIDGLLA
jgi:arylsulfatase A-like enzyme